MEQKYDAVATTDESIALCVEPRGAPTPATLLQCYSKLYENMLQ